MPTPVKTAPLSGTREAASVPVGVIAGAVAGGLLIVLAVGYVALRRLRGAEDKGEMNSITKRKVKC